MAIGGDVKLGQLTRFLFIAPSWKRSLVIIALLGLLIDGVGVRAWVILPVSNFPFSGTIAFTLPALVAPVFLFYAISLGFIFGLRLFVLVAIADYRIPRMLVPAFVQSGTGILAGMFLFPPAAGFLIFALVLHCVFGLGFVLLIWLIERPLQRAFRIRGLAFVNAFIAHTTDGSKGMEDFFREIGEEIFVPQESLFFLRRNGKGVIFTVPNLHPGPMGEIGGGNLPHILHDNFEEETLLQRLRTRSVIFSIPVLQHAPSGSRRVLCR
jgi:putative membrane protein